MMHVFAFKQTLTYINFYLLLNRAVVIDKNEHMCPVGSVV